MALYKMYNGPMVTTAVPAPVALAGGTLKTLMQVKPGATTILRVKAWGYSFDGFALATPGDVELIETDVAATVTAFVANDVNKDDAYAIAQGDPTTALIAVGTSSSGYTASAEGSITATRALAAPQLSSPMTQFIERFPLDEMPVIQNGKFGRIRAKFAAGVNILTWMQVLVG